MSSNTDEIKKKEKEYMVFRGFAGKTTWHMFEKQMARYMRQKYGTRIGDGLWKNELPVIEGDDQIDNTAFQEHAEEVWYSIQEQNPTKSKLLYDVDSGFWQKSWHIKWRGSQWERMYDVVTGKCRDEALLCCENMEDEPKTSEKF